MSIGPYAGALPVPAGSSPSGKHAAGSMTAQNEHIFSPAFKPLTNMKKILAVALGLLWVLLVNAQASGEQQNISHKQFQSVIPHSPNAAALGKFTETPVGTYTGIPSVNIPLYEIHSGKLSLPVGLNYHAGGIKVEEVASWAGLGWAVSAGGQVTRQVRGLPDESGYGFLNHYRKIYNLANMNPQERYHYFLSIENGEMDSEPDIFSYSAGGISGQFFFDTSGNVISDPISKVRIIGLNGWEITDNNGVTYIFDKPEITNASPLSNGLPGPSFSAGANWLLTKMVNATNTDSIVFRYEPTVSTFTTISSQTRYHLLTCDGFCTSKPPVDYGSYNQVYGYRLTRIEFNGGEIIFNKNNGLRLDLPDEQALESVVVRSANNRYYKKYVLHQHFAVSAGAPSTYNPNASDYYRLVLDSVSVYGDGVARVSVYKMEYQSPEMLPHRRSFNQDYWGFYNGANNGSLFAPSVEYASFPGQPPLTYSGANRQPGSAAQTGILKKITYPTGGYAEFEYEHNTALSTRFLGSPTPGIINVGVAPNGPLAFNSPYFHIPFCGEGNNNPTAAIQVTANMGNCAPVQTIGCPLVYLKDSASGWQAPITASGIAIVPANKTYYLAIDLTDVTDAGILNNFFITITWSNCGTPITLNNQNYYETVAGGLRVKKITHTDPVTGNTLIKNYSYKKPGTNYSSGFMVSYPEFKGFLTEHNKKVIDNSTYYFTCNLLTVSSASNYPLLATRGGMVGYSFVTETEGGNGGNGKKEYSFISPNEAPDNIGYNFPFPPATSNEWKRGFPLMEKVYKTQGGSDVPVSVKTFGYTTPQAFNQDALKAGRRNLYTYSDPFSIDINAFEYTVYSVGTGVMLPATDTIIMYPTGNNTQTMTNINEYVYNSGSHSPNESKSKGGNNKMLITKTKYAGDYPLMASSADAATNGIWTLAGHNLLNIPVEQYTIQKDASGIEYIVNGTLTQFAPGKPLPEKVYKLKLDAPLPLASFVPSHINAAAQFVKDVHYKEEVLFNGYDVNANLEGQQKKDDLPLSYLYDYRSSLPVAQAINASREDIAYTSFEADGKGGWTFSGTPANDITAPTGSRTYELAYHPITKNISSSKTYIASFWKYGTVTMSAGTVYRTGRTINGWTYVEYELSNTSSFNITGSGKIDELRLFPKNAQMTTFTYEPLAGITSQSDANGNITYYEYDSMGRLIFVKDADRNILKAMEYKYQAAVNE